MFNLKLRYESRKGFTFVELILFMAISSILMLTFFSILTFNLRSNEINLLQDEVLLNGRYIIEYIKEEISNADRIIPSCSITGLDEKYPTNIGFIIVKIKSYEENPNKTTNIEKTCSYSTYYFKNNKVIRIAADAGNLKLPHYTLFGGHNEIASGVLDFPRISLEDNNIIKFDLSLGKDKKEIVNFKSTIILRCPVVR